MIGEFIKPYRSDNIYRHVSEGIGDFTSMGNIGVNFQAKLSGYLGLMGLDVCMDIIEIYFDPFLSQNYLRNKIFYPRIDC